MAKNYAWPMTQLAPCGGCALNSLSAWPPPRREDVGAPVNGVCVVHEKSLGVLGSCVVSRSRLIPLIIDIENTHIAISFPGFRSHLRRDNRYPLGSILDIALTRSVWTIAPTAAGVWTHTDSQSHQALMSLSHGDKFAILDFHRMGSRNGEILVPHLPIVA